MNNRPFIVRPEDTEPHQPPKHPGTLLRTLVGKDTVGARFMQVSVSETEATGMAEEHVHDTWEQAYYLLEGKCLVEVDGKKGELRAGEIAFFAPGKRHKIIPIGGPTRALVIRAPL